MTRDCALFLLGFLLLSASPAAARCLSIGEVDAGMTPPRLAEAARDCIADGKHEAAMALFLAWSAHGLFDQQRVQDESAHVVLREQQAVIFGGWGEEDMARLREIAGAMRAGGSAPMEAACGWLAARGAPDYRPDYMIARGLLPRRAAEDWRRDGFDPAAAWDRALFEINACPRG